MRWAMVDETYEMDCGLGEIKWNMNNEVRNVKTWENYVGDVTDRIYEVITFISKYFYFKKA